MRILVPIDFSATSDTAIQYAQTLSKSLDAEIILLHVLPDLGPTLGRQPTDELIREILIVAEESMLNTINKFRRDDTRLLSQIVQGSSVDRVLPAIIETDAIDFIVMGNTGAGAFKRIIFGSNTISVINHSTVPVITVPESTKAERITHLLYASDFHNLRNEVKRLVPLAKLLNVSIKIINLPPEYYMEYINVDRLVQDLKSECNFHEIEVCLIKGPDLAHAIQSYSDASEGELVAMFTHHITFLDQIFRRSITRELVWQNKIPLLVITKSDEEKAP